MADYLLTLQLDVPDGDPVHELVEEITRPRADRIGDAYLLHADGDLNEQLYEALAESVADVPHDVQQHLNKVWMVLARLFAERNLWQERAEQAEARVDGQAWDDLEAQRDRLADEVEQLRTELADVHHDLKLAVGDTYATPGSAAVEVMRRLAPAEAANERVRTELARLADSDTVGVIRQHVIDRLTAALDGGQ